MAGRPARIGCGGNCWPPRDRRRARRTRQVSTAAQEADPRGVRSPAYASTVPSRSSRVNCCEPSRIPWAVRCPHLLLLASVPKMCRMASRSRTCTPLKRPRCRAELFDSQASHSRSLAVLPTVEVKSFGGMGVLDGVRRLRIQSNLCPSSHSCVLRESRSTLRLPRRT